MQAYKAADVHQDGYIERREFRLLMHYIVIFSNLWSKFSALDSDQDRRIDVSEFIDGCGELGLQLSSTDGKAKFAEIDTNNGGFILFSEFCKWAAVALSDESDSSEDDSNNEAEAVAWDFSAT